LLRLGGASDDADADIDDVERGRVTGDTDHRQLVASRRQYNETSVIRNSRAMSSTTAWTTSWTGCEPSSEPRSD